jgi:hypothetical protein
MTAEPIKGTLKLFRPNHRLQRTGHAIGDSSSFGDYPA